MRSHTSEHNRILIIGETFRKDSGGGITLINLFHHWSKEQIAVVTDQSRFSSPEYPVAYYQLGRKEVKNKLQLLFVKNMPYSGIISPTQLNKHPSTSKHETVKFSSHLKISIKYCISALLGRYKLSTELKEFIEEFKPDCLYIQPNTYGYVLLARKLMRKYNFKKTSIHFMDDFKFYKTNKSPLLVKLFYKHHLKLLKNIVNKADSCLGISPLMSDEYRELFNKRFYTFHNTVCIEEWKTTKERKAGTETIDIIYSGRIGIANYSAIMETLHAVEELYKTGQGKFMFKIYSPDRPSGLIEKVNTSSCTWHLGFKTQQDIKDILSSANIVLLPLSFEQEAIARVYLSMPTKTSEYLACGAAILVYAPPSTALAAYVREKQFGYLVSEQGPKKITEGIKYLSQDDIREMYIQTALQLAKSEHSLQSVSQNFIDLLQK